MPGVPTRCRAAPAAPPRPPPRPPASAAAGAAPALCGRISSHSPSGEKLKLATDGQRRLRARLQIEQLRTRARRRARRACRAGGVSPRPPPPRPRPRRVRRVRPAAPRSTPTQRPLSENDAPVPRGISCTVARVERLHEQRAVALVRRDRVDHPLAVGRDRRAAEPLEARVVLERDWLAAIRGRGCGRRRRHLLRGRLCLEEGRRKRQGEQSDDESSTNGNGGFMGNSVGLLERSKNSTGRMASLSADRDARFHLRLARRVCRRDGDGRHAAGPIAGARPHHRTAARGPPASTASPMRP